MTFLLTMHIDFTAGTLTYRKQVDAFAEFSGCLDAVLQLEHEYKSMNSMRSNKGTFSRRPVIPFIKVRIQLGVSDLKWSSIRFLNFLQGRKDGMSFGSPAKCLGQRENKTSGNYKGSEHPGQGTPISESLMACRWCHLVLLPARALQKEGHSEIMATPPASSSLAVIGRLSCQSAGH